MKKINDSRMFFWGAVVTLVCAFFFGIIAFYSILIVEPDVRSLMEKKENVDYNLKKAYLELRDPQLFAGYQHFDQRGDAVKKTIMTFDEKIYTGSDITPEASDARIYLGLLLDRRMQGSRLGRTTMFYFLLISAISWVVFFYEKKKAA